MLTATTDNISSEQTEEHSLEEETQGNSINNTESHPLTDNILFNEEVYKKLSNFVKAVLQAVQETVEELIKIKPILSDYWDKEIVTQG